MTGRPDSALTTFPLTIYYGPTVHITSFRAVPDGVDIAAQFSPAPGTKQTVRIQLPWGRSVLQLTAKGEQPSRTATDSGLLLTPHSGRHMLCAPPSPSFS